ncbi:ZIP family metal transporter [Lishizhenia sp.]|uniref:ZIP family metal transporter n=1 Tax=Lishizhenia sp. TaxID=2497594 RepID=UPI00299EFA74|nr:ZIP family metal transporter [Lishizhenia sp.]MDX1447156.1 ZIP family metal transporter [Lishizhenia sp.]
MELINILFLILSVFLGGFIVVFLKNKSQDKTIKLFLSFSGGFLLSIAFIHFIPEIYSKHEFGIGYYILLGFLIQLFLEYFSGGIEHGHIHAKAGGAMQWGLFISLSLHSFIEGIPLTAEASGAAEVMHHAHGHYHGVHSGFNTLLMGIVLHKIPVAIALMTLLLSSGFKQSKAWMVIAAFSLMAPLGMLFGTYGFPEIGIDLDIILAVVVGMFLHISTTIIFESSENHKFNFVKLISLIAGVLLSILVH